MHREVAKEIGRPLGECSVKRFSDGEVQINIEESIRGCDVFVIQSTSDPVNENLMELLIMIDALKRASARTINVVMPYYGYARQDRKARSREPITAKLIANLLETAGATALSQLIFTHRKFKDSLIFQSTILSLNQYLLNTSVKKDSTGRTRYRIT